MLSYNEAATKDQFDILIDELSFLRSSLMEDLLLFNLKNKNPIIKEIKSLTISTRALIFKAGSFIYMYPDKKEDERMAEYCRLKLPDLLATVDILRRQASELFNAYFFSCRKSWQSSNCPSTTNVLEYVNFIINKLEQLNALEHHMERAYEEIESMRRLLCDLAEHLGNSQVKFLLTRFKNVAYQAEHVADSFVAGEGSIWVHKLGLFVVIKDVKILHKELKAMFTMTMTTTCDTVIPTLSSSASSHANYCVTRGSEEGQEVQPLTDSNPTDIQGNEDWESSPTNCLRFVVYMLPREVLESSTGNGDCQIEMHSCGQQS
ncbi:hypothetical protein ACH5RR_034491 [Cinchona calisaya]|uniref:Uncharacterized protein n=1 Tax=Cinchona calisaya TaxID=153742 RepID=A0ABD2YBQ3_9GENT